LNTLSAAGVRVPKPYGFFDGVLVMELIVDETGAVAPRLDDVSLSAETAQSYHQEMIHQIVLMLCAGIIHGDLSEFNVLVDARGPVIIDLPQAVNAAGNNNAQTMFARDVDNMARYFGKFAPEILKLQYAKEIWSLYQNGLLTPDVELTGAFEESSSLIDLDGVMEAILDAQREHEEKLARGVEAPQTVGVEHAAEQWAAREERPRKGGPRPAEANRGKGKSENRDRPPVPGRSNGGPPAQKPADANPRNDKDKFRQNAPIPNRPPPAPSAPPKPVAIEVKPPAEMKWGRRPGR
jgi:RIO kinase 1